MNPLAAFLLLPTGLLAAAACAAASSSFTMSLSPPGVVGTFVWTNACCRVSGEGLVFSFSCDGGCACGGCVATGFFSYEGYRLPARGGRCPCGGSVEPDHGIWDGDDGKPSPLPGASACFSKRVILFEDEYEDAPGVTVPWRSTETELDCSASGGPNGGRVRIELRGADGLVPYGGCPLPFERELGPFEEVSFRNAYRAVRPSGGEGGIVVRAAFEENGTGEAWTTEDRATAVRVRLCPEVYAPQNECVYRHRVGIGEVVNCEIMPDVQDVIFVVLGKGRFFSASGQYICPLKAEQNWLKVVGGGAEYVPQTSAVEPSTVRSSDVSFEAFGLLPCQAGGIALKMRLHAAPLDVSFSNVKIEEVPDVGGTRVGYFADSFFMREWYHGEQQGAGVWFPVVVDNEFLLDVAGLKKAMPQVDSRGGVSLAGTNGWTSGTLTWNVPCGWGDNDVEKGDSPVGIFADEALQIMTIDAEGNCGVQKHGNSVSRTINGLIRLNGKAVK